MEEIVAKLPKGIGFDWTGISYQERMAKSQARLLYTFSIIVIFLCLAALYESWTVPFANLLVLPLGSIRRRRWPPRLRGLPNDVYFQIGLLTALGLTTKNAILIVQFAMAKARGGHGADRGHPGRGQITVASDRHDLPGLCLWGPAPGHGHRRRRRRPNCHWHRRSGWDDVPPPSWIFFIPLFFVVVCSSFAKSKAPRRQTPVRTPHSPSGGAVI